MPALRSREPKLKKMWRYLGLGVGFYLFFLISQLPAEKAYGWLKSQIALPVELFQLEGSLWAGQAAIAKAGRQQLTDIQWCWRPLSLFLGRVEISVLGHYQQQPIEMAVGLSFDRTIVVSDVQAELTMTSVEPLINPAPLGLTGKLIVDVQRLRFDEGRLAAVEGKLEWQEGGIGAPLNTTLGSYQVDLVNEGDSIHGALKDSSGPIQLEGVLVFERDGRYQLSATLAARDASRQDIKQALRMLGTPSPAGKVSLKRSGRFNPAAALSH